jgi:thioredoxin reductase (NADPH)
MSLIDTRGDQMFPTLDAAQLQTACRFTSGPERRFAPGEVVFDVGEAGVPVWLIVEGAIDLVRRDGLAHEAAITTQGAGQFTGEVSQLAGRGSLARGTAGPDGCVAAPIDAAHLRALMIGSAEIGELVMRALILRRVGLIEADASGSILVGRTHDAALVRLQGFLTRNGYPNTLLDVDTDAEAQALVERLAVRDEDLPLMICPNGNVLKRPSDGEAGVCLGMTPALDAETLYDVIVVGAGPAGLATSVYAASEGLSVLVLDQRAIGGQAGASARIENYLGFPTGISGQALAGRAYNQALKFGAELAIPLEAERLHCDAVEDLGVTLSGGVRVRGRSIVIASGARYRRPDIENLAMFEGAGVSYWASPIEAKMCEHEDVALVGAGNSAGQAVVYLAPRVRSIQLIVRGAGLEASMSRYLIERIAALPNVTVRAGTEVTAVEGDVQSGLTGATLRDRASGETEALALRHLFLFVGADPNTGWLDGCIDTDAKGFVRTGEASLSLQTNKPGVFAIGDVRAASTKRVAAAVGEGAAVVSQVHEYLATLR